MYKTGLSNTRTNHIWRQMRYRCSNPNDSQWKDYGGRGIKVCDRWMKFENFIEDMGLAPDGLTIERRDTNGNYEKDNCYWATWEQQANNRSNNNVITAFGRSQTLTQWARERKMPVSTLKNRLFRAGMTPEDALTAARLPNINKTPKGQRRERKDSIIEVAFGKFQSRRAHCKEHGVSLSTVNGRMSAGMTLEEALQAKPYQNLYKRGGA